MSPFAPRIRSLVPLFFVVSLGAAAAPAPTAAGLSVVDARGRTVTFPSLPRRIAVAGRSVTLIADALYLFPEARERVVAIPSGSVQLSDRFLSLLDPGLSS